MIFVCHNYKCLWIGDWIGDSRSSSTTKDQLFISIGRIVHNQTNNTTRHGWDWKDDIKLLKYDDSKFIRVSLQPWM